MRRKTEIEILNKLEEEEYYFIYNNNNFSCLILS